MIHAAGPIANALAWLDTRDTKPKTKAKAKAAAAASGGTHDCFAQLFLDADGVSNASIPSADFDTSNLAY